MPTLFRLGLIVGVAAILVLGASGAAYQWQSAAVSNAATVADKPDWLAVAPGMVEPRGGFAHLSARAPGQIAKLLVVAGQTVAAGDLLAELENAEQRAQVQGAEAEVAFRKAERDRSVSSENGVERRDAEDRLAAASAALAEAKSLLDNAAQSSGNGRAETRALEQARAAVERAQAERDAAQSALDMIAALTAAVPPSRTESALAIARSELASARASLERTRIRAPVAGTVLEVRKAVGETVGSSPSDVFAVIGDLSRLRLRAEVSERCSAKIRVGQSVMVRTDALDHDAKGRVTYVAKGLREKRILPRTMNASGGGNVLEVLVDLDDAPSLLPGMRVDVFFEATRIGEANVQ